MSSLKKTPLKSNSEGLKRSPLKQGGPKSLEQQEEKKKAQEKMWDMFLLIWNKREHKCENCDRFLGYEPLTIFFDHLFEKSTRKDLKYEEDNIMLLCFECHDSKTRGFLTDKIKERIKKVKDRFG